MAQAQTTSESDFAQEVDSLTGDEEGEAALLDLLRESHAAYQGRSEQTAARMRGYVLTALSRRHSLGQGVIPFLREEFETGHNPYVLGAAARALIRVRPLDENWVPLLDTAIQRIRSGDDAIQFETYPLDPAKARTTTAVAELLKAKSHLLSEAPQHSLRARLLTLRHPSAYPKAMDLSEIDLQDQEGQSVKFGDFFKGRRTFLTFFYTRCNNPQKCSANIWRWGSLLNELQKRDAYNAVRSAAITYDPDYDLPARLQAYAADRSVNLSENHRVFRVPDRFIDFRRAFDLHVGYSQATVNKHASEAFVLDAEGQIEAALVRQLWTVDEVLARLLNGSSAPTSS